MTKIKETQKKAKQLGHCLCNLKFKCPCPMYIKTKKCKCAEA